MSFFVHGTAYRAEEELAAPSRLAAGDALVSCRAGESGGRGGAAGTHQGPVHIGFVPRYLCPDISVLTEEVSVTVQRVNHPPAPMQFRLLVRFEAAWPAGFRPFSGAAFQPLAAGDPRTGSSPVVG